MISAGSYRHRVTIQSCATSEDELGQPRQDWQDVVPGVSALVEDLRGRELVAAQEVHGTVTVAVRLRWRSAITARMRVLYQGEVYTIEAVIRADPLGVEMVLLCSSGLVQ